jgi:NTP pyrophosphatase (non-canonical NTP hydrolase)
VSEIKELIEKIIKFRDKRDWKQFHKPKDLAISLSLESAELLEHFQWKNEREIEDYIKNSKEEIAEELADVLYWVLLMSNELNIDIVASFNRKMLKNENKYPVSKAKGSHKKYDEL